MARKLVTIFKVVVADSAEEMESRLDFVAGEGWSPVGGIATAAGFKGTVFAQLMTKSGTVND